MAQFLIGELMRKHGVNDIGIVGILTGPSLTLARLFLASSKAPRLRKGSSASYRAGVSHFGSGPGSRHFVAGQLLSRGAVNGLMRCKEAHCFSM